ncbi:hypothetical protein [Paenibacillus sp. Marseille-Q4541]|uniref:hypothetical protein n=1 Tax=Paenibacillus sp. Marseille-Q4541 TaxID=2831522 RepID=UPI001BAB01D3|nr:hypothetical protein [Paenibacillus sp. Marseille-Q4541]
MFSGMGYRSITIEPFCKEHSRFYTEIKERAITGYGIRQDPADSQFAFVAVAEGKEAGIIFTYHNQFHPFCTYVSLMVLPSTDRELVAAQLLEAVSELRVVYPLQISIWDTDFAIKQALVKQGFYEIRSTYDVHIETSKAYDVRDEDVLMRRHSDYQLLKLSELLKSEQGEEELALLVKKTYEYTHRVNPPEAFELFRWKAFLHEQDVIKQGSYVVIHRTTGRCAGFAMLHSTSDEFVAELGWRGVASSEELDLITLVTREQIKYAIDNGIHQLKSEVDSTDPYQMEMLNVYPFEPAPAWVTYHRQR